MRRLKKSLKSKNKTSVPKENKRRAKKIKKFSKIGKVLKNRSLKKHADLKNGRHKSPIKKRKEIYRGTIRRKKVAISSLKGKSRRMGKKIKELERKTNSLLIKGRSRCFVTYDEILKEFVFL